MKSQVEERFHNEISWNFMKCWCGTPLTPFRTYFWKPSDAKRRPFKNKKSFQKMLKNALFKKKIRLRRQELGEGPQAPPAVVPAAQRLARLQHRLLISRIFSSTRPCIEAFVEDRIKVSLTPVFIEVKKHVSGFWRDFQCFSTLYRRCLVRFCSFWTFIRSLLPCVMKQKNKKNKLQLILTITFSNRNESILDFAHLPNSRNWTTFPLTDLRLT